jgi:hypothetical protein
MSFNYQPNYMALIKALQSGGLEGASQAKQARATRGLGGRRILDTQKVSDSEAASLTEQMLSYFSEIDEQNKAAKEKSQAQRELIEGLGGEVDPVTGEAEPVKQEAAIQDFDESMIEIALGALSDVESRGSGGYKARGPVVKSGMYKGQRAYGKYQVMEGNIGPWTEKYHGERLTAEQFLNNPEAQDTVAENLILSNWRKYGNIEDAISVWFTGKPYKKAASLGAADQNINVTGYVEKWRNSYNKRYNEFQGEDS